MAFVFCLMDVILNVLSKKKKKTMQGVLGFSAVVLVLAYFALSKVSVEFHVHLYLKQHHASLNTLLDRLCCLCS